MQNGSSVKECMCTHKGRSFLQLKKNFSIKLSYLSS